MANEFIARKGLISSGSINVSGSVTASYFKGDGSQLTNLPATTVLSSSVNIDTYTFPADGSTVDYLLSQSYNINSLLVTSLAATTPAAGDVYYMQQSIEGFNVADLGFGTATASTITISFWVRSSLTGTFGDKTEPTKDPPVLT